MNKFLQYLGLGTAVVEAIPMVEAALTIKPAQGSSLADAVHSALMILSVITGKQIPQALVNDIAQAVADVLNKAQ